MGESEFPRNWFQLAPFTVFSSGTGGLWRTGGRICCNAVIKAVRIRESPAGGSSACRKVITVGTRLPTGGGLIYSTFDLPARWAGVIYRDLNIQTNHNSIFVDCQIPSGSPFCRIRQQMDVDLWILLR